MAQMSADGSCPLALQTVPKTYGHPCGAAVDSLAPRTGLGFACGEPSACDAHAANPEAVLGNLVPAAIDVQPRLHTHQLGQVKGHDARIVRHETDVVCCSDLDKGDGPAAVVLDNPYQARSQGLHLPACRLLTGSRAQARQDRQGYGEAPSGSDTT